MELKHLNSESLYILNAKQPRAGTEITGMIMTADTLKPTFIYYRGQIPKNLCLVGADTATDPTH